MLVICDVNEYRRSIKDFKISLVLELFEKLHALCNLLVVVPENLKQVCSNAIHIIEHYFPYLHKKKLQTRGSALS
jgi:hypothetical protein